MKEHEIMRDPTALQIFIWILISVDYKTGKMISGRFWASSILGVNPNTYYKSLKRLEKKYNLVTLHGNNKNTTILVNKWDQYQKDVTTTSNTNGNNKVTTGQQQSNTNQEIKEIKEIKNIYNSNEAIIFSYFEKLDESDERVVAIAKEFDIRPKDVVYVVREMLSVESDKGREIKSVKLKLNRYINNAIRWHKVSTISSKEKKGKKPKLSEEDQQIKKWIEEGRIM